MLPVLPFMNSVARLSMQLVTKPNATYKMLKRPRPVQVFKKRKSRLIKWKSKNEKNIKKAKMLHDKNGSVTQRV